MIAIGGYINIGIVFYETIHLPNAFRQLADYLAEKEMSITKVKFSKDSDGEIWIEQSIKENIIKDDNFSGYYTEFELSGSKLNDMTINIQKETGYVGFVICLKWTEVVSHDVIHLQQEIIRCLVDLYHTFTFEYAFIGHEIEVEIHPNEFEKCLLEQHAFPVALIGKGNHIDIYYGDVAIDGLSSQERRMECLKVKR
ncbi:Imm64 family immunity protein [Bacillus safensis]|uniref:Imm64 family immunity protein n=1 Tax=Bacillus TaxID=1386 RepID=UPI00203D9FBF|nr:Imm64 family immunity protein [Bacillus safensis]MCM2985976.1 Imm64 family immunity protein [Bacillus safensis]MCY7445097.1 Imm64 family immunity protein [Bacillus safensis]MCY7457046.1 Imm64 family immunity protein [Bacillus safensis]MCY7465381.1 Imm64 family immunity protein [Bacillus safensis]MDP4566563.1 Imm64 family immunity protein [Bacillus safensis]